MLIMLIK